MKLLKKDRVFMGFNITEFVKIDKYSIEKAGTDNDGDYFTATVNVKRYTNESLEYEITDGTNQFAIQGLRENTTSLEDIFNWLKSLSDFDWYEEV